MKVKRNITVELSPKEIKEIIIKYLKENDNIEIEHVSFNIETIYSGHMDQYGSDELSGASCEGTLSNDD